MISRKDKSRWMWWPIRIKFSAASASTWFRRHGWQTGFERVAVSKTSFGCMPGFRSVFGQTWHFGRLKVCLGCNLEDGGWLARTTFRNEYERLKAKFGGGG